jgi:hypothetical protein
MKMIPENAWRIRQGSRMTTTPESEASKQEFARRVDALAAMDSVRAWFDETITRWACKLAEQRVKDSRNADELLPLLPLRPHVYSIPEKAAVLARLHDIWLAGQTPLGIADDSANDPGEWGIYWPYFKLVCEGASQVPSESIPVLERFLAGICAELEITPPLPSNDTSRHQNKKTTMDRDGSSGWIQADLDEEIRKYKAQRAPTYSDLKAAVQAGKKGARYSARKLYGRNALARHFHAPKAMVTKSRAWRAIASDLLLEKYSVGALKQIGLDVALDQSSRPGSNSQAEVDEHIDREDARKVALAQLIAEQTADEKRDRMARKAS